MGAHARHDMPQMLAYIDGLVDLHTAAITEARTNHEKSTAEHAAMFTEMNRVVEKLDGLARAFDGLGKSVEGALRLIRAITSDVTDLNESVATLREIADEDRAANDGVVEEMAAISESITRKLAAAREALQVPDEPAEAAEAEEPERAPVEVLPDTVVEPTDPPVPATPAGDLSGPLPGATRYV